jgi:integrase
MPKTKKDTRARHGQGSMRHDASRDLWVAQITINGQRKTVARKTQRDCQTELDKLIQTMRAGEVVTRRKGLTVADILNHWLTQSLPNEVANKGKGGAPATRVQQSAIVRRLVEVIGERPVAKLTVDQIERGYEVIATRSDQPKPKPISRDYLGRFQDVLLRAMRDAERRRVVSRAVVHVVADAQLPLAKASPAKQGETRRALTADEMRRLLAASEPHRLHALFVLALSTGIRPGEMIGVYWEDLHLDADVPYVSLNRAVQVQANRRFAVVPQMKNAGAYRDIELSAAAVVALRAHRVAQNVERLAATSWANPDLVFPSTRGTVLNPSNVRREFANLCALANVPKIVPNEGRHTVTTLLTESEMNTYKIADLLGHTSDRMINQHYRKRRKEIVRGSSAVVDQFLAK